MAAGADRRMGRDPGPSGAGKWLFMFAAATVLATVATTSAQALLLAVNGEPRAAIVQPSGKLTGSESIAVRDLARYLGQITGAEFPVVTDDAEPADEARIYIGRSAAERLGIDPGELEKDEWIVRTQGGDLYLTGGRWFGAEYAVNHFLEDVLGVHWWTPWDETVPSIPDLKIGALDLRGMPAFPYSRQHDGKHFERYTFNSHNGATRDAFADAEGNFSWGGSPRGLGNAHTLPSMIPWEEHGEEHPEWFARKDGGVIGAGGRTFGHCFTNPELAGFVARKIRLRIREEMAEAVAGPVIHPVPFDYHLSPADHAPPCRCPWCVGLTRAEESAAAPLIQMLNRIAAEVREAYPWAVISTLAYEFSRKPPRSMRVADGVLVRFCTETMNIAAPFDHPSNRTVREELLGWARQAGMLGIWSYESDFAPHRGFGGYGVTWDLPIPNVQLIADRYRYWREHGVISIFQQTLGQDDIQPDMRPLKVWLSCKLMEDPDRDYGGLVRTFTEGFYGPAGVHIRAYLDLLQDAARQHPSHIRFFAGLGRYRYLTLDFLTEATAVFDRARAEVVGDPVLMRRVRRARLGVDRAVMFLWPKLVAEWVRRGNTAQSMPLDRDVAINRYDETFREQMAKRELPENRWPHKKYGRLWSHFRHQHEKRRAATLAAVERNVYIAAAVPEKFAGLEVYDYPVGGAQYKFGENEWTAIVDDSQAAAGKAIRVHGDGLHLPVRASTRTIRPADVPGEGYHWYDLGRMLFSQRAGASVFEPNTVRAYAFEYGSFDVWVSLKFDGPAFAHGDPRAENAAWLERMILVRPGSESVKGNLSLPQRWTVFGPFERNDPVASVESLRPIPDALTLGGRTIEPQVLTAEDGRLDLATLLGGTAEGKTAYVFIAFHLDAAQELTLGLGADWWFQAWLDGEPLMDTLEQGNGAWPPSAGDHVKTVSATEGPHVLAVRHVSGSGSSVLAVAGPDALRGAVISDQ